MHIGDHDELDMKRVSLKFLLRVEEGGHFEDVDHAEEILTDQSKTMFDPNVQGKEGNVEHIEFDYGVANNLDRGLHFM